MTNITKRKYYVSDSRDTFTDFRPSVAVVTCMLSCDGILFLRRAAGTLSPGTWAIPGGKVEQGETLGQALERELHEELGITLPAGVLQGPVPLYARAPSCDYDLYVYHHVLDTRPALVLSPLEHDASRWCSITEEKSLQLLPNQAETLTIVRSAHQLCVGDERSLI